MEAAAASVSKGKWGMFCIPGVAELDHLDMAADYGMGFVRVGVGVDHVEDGQPFIAKAKKLGLYVATNFMKSYTRPPKVFAKTAVRAAEMGADAVYVVDSAGNMTPPEMRAYVEAVRAVSDMPIGVHAHNNLGLANANALEGLRLWLRHY